MIWIDEDIKELAEMLAEAGISGMRCDYDGTNFQVHVARGWENQAGKALCVFRDRLQEVPDRMRFTFIQSVDGKIARYKPATRTLH